MSDSVSKIAEHMNVTLPIKVLAQRYAEDAQWTTDCGIVRVKAGQWHVTGEGYEATLDDDEFRKAISKEPTHA
jgi:hypothetical protein